VIIDEVQRAPEVLLAIKESATMRSVSFRNLTSRLREKISGSSGEDRLRASCDGRSHHSGRASPRRGRHKSAVSRIDCELVI
jgi:hypothetical protein